MADTVVVGLQWGDEGKGKLVDEIAPRFAAVVRFHGGANAGHTVVVAGGRRVLHQVPTGALHCGVRCVIAAGCVVEPAALRREVAALGIDPTRLAISPRAHVVLPSHLAADAAQERMRGAHALGTTLRGIGPAYAAKVERWGLTVGQMIDASARAAALQAMAPWVEGGRAAAIALAGTLGESAEWMRPFVTDDLAALRAARRRGPVLFEGHLGVMRDLDRGAYPYVTSASVLPAAALVGAEAAVWGVAKPYVTAVGAGPLPTEARPGEAERMGDAGGEFGATTGRRRRVGFLDLPALRYAVNATGVTHLALQMKTAPLGAVGRFPVCVAYDDWDESAGYPQEHELARVRPVYEEWKVPEDAAATVACAQRIADAVGVPLAYVGTGAERGAFVEMAGV